MLSPCIFASRAAALVGMVSSATQSCAKPRDAEEEEENAQGNEQERVLSKTSCFFL
jgi:hypothetical protein